MIIIPYNGVGNLNSNSMYHFTSLRDAMSYAYNRFLLKNVDNEDSVTTRFRILDSEEDFTITHKIGSVEFKPTDVHFFA